MKRFLSVFILTALVLGLPAIAAATPQEAGSVEWVDNGVTHQYRIYSDPSTDWDSASNWVNSALGSSWHLATITSAAEQGFFAGSILPFLPYGEFWLGASQDPLTTADPSANWVWVTGEPWSYTNWASGEPNDANGGWMEQHLAIHNGGWNDEGYLPNIYGFVAEREIFTLAVTIDIHPGGFPNSINPSSKGVTPVAILTTPNFDATTVDASTVRFGATGSEAAPLHFAIADVDGDGDLDMILQFRTAETGIVCGMTSASLSGLNQNGQAIAGSDSVKTVGCE